MEMETSLKIALFIAFWVGLVFFDLADCRSTIHTDHNEAADGLMLAQTVSISSIEMCSFV